MLLALALLGHAACGPSAARAQPAGPAQAAPVVIEQTPSLAAGYLRVHVQLWSRGQGVLAGEAGPMDAYKNMANLQNLDGFLDQQGEPVQSFGAFLDTGASGYVVSESVVRRFGVRAEAGAVYHETGLHGPTPMHVSVPYAVALDGAAGMFDAPDQFRTVEQNVRFQIKQGKTDPMIEMAFGGINVVGMPAIRRLIVEIDPAPGGDAEAADRDADDAPLQLDLNDPRSIDRLLEATGGMGGPGVTLHGPSHRPGPIDLVVPLRYTNFSRRANPQDRGPLPTLSDNPTVPDIRTAHAGRSYTASWLLDTGAPASIISVRHAAALGLVDARGEAVEQVVSYLPLGGISGKTASVPGFRVDRLWVPTADGRGIEYHDVTLFVHDISTTLDDGRTVTLDGVFGLNLLTPGLGGVANGLLGGGGIAVAPPPFRRIWIHGPRGEILLDLPDAPR